MDLDDQGGKDRNHLGAFSDHAQNKKISKKSERVGERGVVKIGSVNSKSLPTARLRRGIIPSTAFA